MPSSIACAAVRPLNTVSTWSASTEAPYVAPNRKVTRSWNSVSRTAPKLPSVGQRLVAHLHRVGDLGSAGCGVVEVCLNDKPLSFTLEANPHRRGAAMVALASVLEQLKLQNNVLTVRLG